MTTFYSLSVFSAFEAVCDIVRNNAIDSLFHFLTIKTHFINIMCIRFSFMTCVYVYHAVFVAKPKILKVRAKIINIFENSPRKAVVLWAWVDSIAALFN